MSLIKKFQTGGSVYTNKKEPVKYKFQTDLGDIELDKEKLQEEVLNTDYYKSLNDNEKLRFRQELEDLYDKAGSTGNIRVTSTGNEVSGLYGTEGAYGLGYKTKEEIDSIKNRKERRAAKAEFNRRMDANMAYAQAILRLRDKEKNAEEDRLNKERLGNREKVLQGLENVRNYFPYKYGKNQLGASYGDNSLNEVTIMKNLMNNDLERNKEFLEFAKTNKDYLMNIDDSDEELNKNIFDKYNFSLSDLKTQISNLDPNKREDAIKIFELSKNAIKPRWLWDKSYFDSLSKDERNKDLDSFDGKTTSKASIETEEQNNKLLDKTPSEEDIYDITRNRYRFGGKDYSYREMYDAYKSNTPFGDALRNKYPDFIKDTKTIIPGINSNLIDINIARKEYGDENTILPMLRGFSHVYDVTPSVDLKDQDIKIVKAANEGILKKNPYSNVQDNTYVFVFRKDKDGNVKKYNAKEGVNEFGEYTYTYIDESGKPVTVSGKATDTADNKYSPFRFNKVYKLSDIGNFFKEGGEIPKYQYGGSIAFGDDSRFKDKGIEKDSSQSQGGKKESEHRASLGEVFDKNYKMTAADKLEVASLLSDAASLGLGLTGVGSVPSAITGAIGSATGYAADVNREGVTFGNTAGLIGNLGLDVVTAIPIAGNLAKSAKMVKWAKRASKMLTAYGLGNSAMAANKIISDPANATIEDYQSLVNGLRSVVGGRKQMGDVSKKTIKTETVIKAKNGPDGKVVDIKLNPQQTEKLNTLSSSEDKISFLKEVAKPHLGKDVNIDNIGIMPIYGRMKLQSPISIKEKSIKSPITRDIEYSRTKKTVSPINKEDIAKIKSSEDKWDFDYINSKGEDKQIKLSPIYKGYKKVFGIPTANNLESARVKEETKALIGSPKAYKKKQTLYSNNVVKNPEYYQSREAFIKQHPEYAGKSEEEIIDAMTEQTNKMNFVRTMQEAKKAKPEKIKKLNEEIEALNKNESDKAERFTKYIKRESAKDNKKIAEDIYKRKEARKDAEKRLEDYKENKKIAEIISERKESREKAKERLKEYKKNIDEKAKEAAGKKAKIDRDREIAEYKRKKSQNKATGKEVAKREAIRRNKAKDEYKNLSKREQEKLESATEGRSKRKKIVKNQLGGEINPFKKVNLDVPKVNTGNKISDFYYSNILNKNKIEVPKYTLSEYSKDIFNQKGIDGSRRQLLFKKYENKPMFKNKIINSIKNIGSKIDPLTISEAGRAIAGIINNNKQDTKYDVALASSPSEIYLRETGIGASNFANNEANAMINSSRDNLTSDAKLNYLINQDLASKYRSIRERGFQQDREAALNKAALNLDKASQYANIRANIASSNAAAIAAAKNAKRTMDNQVRYANSGIINSFWASQNMKNMQRKQALDAYDKMLNEQLVDEEYNRKLEPYTRAFNELATNPNTRKEDIQKLREEQAPGLRRLNMERIKNIRKVISGDYVPQYKKGGNLSVSDFFDIDSKIKKQANDYLKEIRDYNMKKSLIFYRNSLMNKRK